MFFIFGWGRTTIKWFGRVLPLKCGNCHNVQYWDLVRKRKWFTLFFIPIIPYENNYYLICPICKGVNTLNKEMLEKAKYLITVTEKFMANPPEITKEEYTKQISQTNLFER